MTENYKTICNRYLCLIPYLYTCFIILHGSGNNSLFFESTFEKGEILWGQKSMTGGQSREVGDSCPQT